MDQLLSLFGLDTQRVRILEMPAPVPDLHAPQFCQLRYAAGKFREYGLFPRAQFGEVDLRRAEGDAAMFRLLRGGKHVRGVKQRFRRDAAAVQANAAEPFVLLDQDDLFAEVGGVKRGGVPPGPGADNDHFGFCGVHEFKYGAMGRWGIGVKTHQPDPHRRCRSHCFL